jgi:AcrR family transcriptional regulator
MRAAAAEAILDAAEEVASERGLEAASCAAIAERAGVAVGTLYNYFPDRDGLIAALFKARRDELLPRVVAAAEAHATLPFEARLRGFLREVMASYEEQRRFIRLALDADRSMPKVKDPRHTHMVRFLGALEDIFADGAKDGHVVAGRHVEFARMLLGALKAMTLLHIERGTAFTDDAELLVDTFLHGVRARGRA